MAASPSSPLSLTASDRLARQLREDYSLACRAEGASVWEAPPIASFARWLIDAWTATWPDAQLLSATQELVLWLEAVERDESGRRLLSPLAAAREARRADQLVRRYRIDLDSAPAWQDEHQAFRRWRAQLMRRMQRHGWITGADLPWEVARLLREQRIAPPPHLQLHGFVRPPAPGEQAVLDALAALGSRIEHVQAVQPAAPRLLRLSFADEEAQFRFLAERLRERLATAGEGRASPPPRILIALPDPESRRDLLDSVFRELLAPWALQGEALLPWRWERGTPLADQASVDLMLGLLQLGELRNPPALLTRVLLSGLLWSEDQRALTAAAELQLRLDARPAVGLARLCELLPETLRARFEALRAELRQAPRRALPSEWAQRFRRRLELLRWPVADATLDSLSFQAVAAARSLLDRLATLDAQLDRVPESSAREWLAEFARATRFQPSVDYEQPVLITDLDEAAGLRADLLFVCDASAANWPRPLRASPFLPIDTLRAAGVVEALPELALQQARSVSGALMQQLGEGVLACARVDARGAEQRPSALFGEAADWRPQEVPVCIGALESCLTRVPLLQMPGEDPVPPVDPIEQAGLRPASALFKDWFESPFFALCRHRLGITALPDPPRGLPAAIQGSLVHALLAEFWAAVPDRAGLRRAAAEPERLRARLEPLIDRLLPEHLPEPDFGPALLRLERERVLDLVQQWLQHEARRVDDFTVVHREVAVAPGVAGLRLNLRLDRVDRVAAPSGERWLVIDYKTGRDADPRGWKAERLSEPQLPLYAGHAAALAAGVPHIDGICFGHLRDGHPALVALTNWRQRLIEEPAGRYRQDWDQQLDEWRAAIERAANGFLAGEAWLDPRVGARSYNADLLLLAGPGAGAEDEAGEPESC